MFATENLQMESRLYLELVDKEIT